LTEQSKKRDHNQHRASAQHKTRVLPGASFAAVRGVGESAAKLLASFPDEPEHGKQLISTFLNTDTQFLRMPANPPRNPAQDSSFPLHRPISPVKPAEFGEISGRPAGKRERGRGSEDWGSVINKSGTLGW